MPALFSHISVVMGIVLASSMVDHGFEHRWGKNQTLWNW